MGSSADNASYYGRRIRTDIKSGKEADGMSGPVIWLVRYTGLPCKPPIPRGKGATTDRADQEGRSLRFDATARSETTVTLRPEADKGRPTKQQGKPQPTSKEMKGQRTRQTTPPPPHGLESSHSPLGPASTIQPPAYQSSRSTSCSQRRMVASSSSSRWRHRSTTKLATTRFMTWVQGPRFSTSSLYLVVSR